MSISLRSFLCNRAIILTDHQNYAEQALRACSAKKTNPDREALTQIILNRQARLLRELQDRPPHFCWAAETYFSSTHSLRKRFSNGADLRLTKQIFLQVRKLMCKYEAFLQRSMPNTSKYLEMLLYKHQRTTCELQQTRCYL